MITTETISKYWDKQAVIWAEEKQEAWLKEETEYWLQFFKALLPTLSGNRALEVGTASGYFANILVLAGYEVTAVDYSSAMITEAKQVTRDLGLDVHYEVMDAQKLAFPEDSFDLVFSRLMTWNLPDTFSFYHSSFRVLKPAGVLLNFDGDFGEVTFSQEGHERYPANIMEEANTIKAQLEISKLRRPEADVQMLNEIGFTDVNYDLQAQNHILQIVNEESSLFELRGVKPLKNN